MSQTSSNNKRIAKNTLLLYFRMLLIMVVTLYMSRVVLEALGVEDFGIYNVVGGVVSMLGVLSGTMSSAISRFFTFELGKGDDEQLKRVFCSSVTIQLFLCLIVLIVAETVGLWFLNSKMNIPDGRIFASNWVFQFSVITFCVNLLSAPYNAAIIAHERMTAFAYVSIIEAVIKLAIAYMITISPFDRLLFYALLMMLVSLLVRFCYTWYCKKHFEECVFHFLYDRLLLKKMFGFAGWNFIGASSAILRDQGGNILINIFAGPAVNAARGIAMQVSHAVLLFSQNFMTAVNPQITKNYANGNHEYMMTLIYQGSRLSFYMLLLFSLPLFLNTEFVLDLWLKKVPEHAVLFTRLALAFAMSSCLSGPLITAMLATGNIKNYQLVVGGLQMLNLPVSYLLLMFGLIPEVVAIVAVIIDQCCMFARVFMLQNMIHIDMKKFYKKVFFNVISVAIIASIVPFFLKINLSESLLSFVIVSSFSVFFVLLTSLFVGSTSIERQFVFSKVKKLIVNKL